jgi:uncharacterized protein (UPF0261 family)
MDQILSASPRRVHAGTIQKAQLPAVAAFGALDMGILWKNRNLKEASVDLAS